MVAPRTYRGNSMLTRLSQKNVAAAAPGDAPYEIRDTQIQGLILRVQPSGVKSFIVQWGRGKRVTLKPRYPVMTLDTARTQAHAILTQSSDGATPELAQRRPKSATLRAFLDHDLEPWAIAHRKWGAGSVKRIKAAFADRLDKPLTDLNAWVIEKWRSQRLKAGIADATVNRELAGLKSALAKAVLWHALEANPLDGSQAQEGRQRARPPSHAGRGAATTGRARQARPRRRSPAASVATSGARNEATICCPCCRPAAMPTTSRRSSCSRSTPAYAAAS